ncbi:unnamed protein product, partial [Prorocentrum cordatum]
PAPRSWRPDGPARSAGPRRSVAGPTALPPRGEAGAVAGRRGLRAGTPRCLPPAGEKGGHEEKGHHVGSGEERSNECVPKDGPYRSAAVGPQPSNGDEESRSGRTRRRYR